MHTIKVIAAGLLILGAVMLLSNAWAVTKLPTAVTATSFLAAWFAISLLNLWIGVRYAGYSLTEELPIMAAVFFVPTACLMVCLRALRI
ncbi:hypothetical protein [Xanthomonas campestris]|uniref:hypothetical protein n=1 Tax=Xanthomonas campestris TaxID=339 RepID=UPI000E0FCAC3|nr:hypothetical protein [Xanthomonas campestris]